MYSGAKQTFGAAASTGFGYNAAANTSPFGAQTAFGKPQSAGFGQQPAFGQATSLFGQTQPTTSLFGANTAPPAFGVQAPAQTGFGTSMGFGQPQQQQQQQQTPLFGATAQPTQNTSLFGQPSTSGFGAPKPTGFGFGATQPATSLFGQPSTSAAPGTGFGGFGTNTTSGTATMFSAAATPAFGQAQPGANGSAIAKYQPAIGSDTLMKNGTTNNVNTKQHCITAMKEYENKCLEEIRMEDYMANRKGPQAGAAPAMFGSAPPATTSLFGTPVSQPSTGLFGQQTQPAATMGGFGAPTNQMGAFGQQPSAFGQQANQQQAPAMFGKAFQAPATSTAPFGGFSTATANSSLFGAKPFGQPAAGGLFGQPAAAPAPAFGQAQQPQPGGFGSFGQTSVNQPNSLFGGGATTTNAGAFGMASSAPNNSFGFSNPSTSTVGGGLFGAKPATGFGTTPAFGTQTSAAPGGFGSFGQPAQPGGLFSNSFAKPAAPTFSGFGAQAAAPTLGLGMGGTSSSLFGNTANKPGGLFGNTTAPTQGSMFGSTFGQNNTLGGMGQNTMGMNQSMMGNLQPAGIPIHQQILSLATSPYGDNPIFKDLKPMGSLSEDALKPTNPAAQKAMLESSNQYKISPKVGSAMKIKPVGTYSNKSLFGGLEECDSSVEESFSLKPNAKRLVLKPKIAQPSTAYTQSPGHQNKFLDSSTAQESPRQLSSIRNATTKQTGTSDDAESFRNQIPTSVPIARADENTRRVSWLHSNALEKVTKQNRISELAMDNTIQELVTSKDDNSNQLSRRPISEAAPVKTSHLNAHTSNESISFLDETNPDVSLLNLEVHPAGIVLKRTGYYTIPSLNELTDYIGEDGSCKVPNFTVGRNGYGNVYFDVEIDVAGLNLDELVHFRHKEVIIYPDDENKPAVGKGLNRKAQVTLDQVWPHDKTDRKPIKDRERLEEMGYEDKLRRVCEKHDMRYIDYRPETGSWVFKVEHFSKYGLSDSDEEDAPVDPKKAKLAQQIPNPNVLATAKSDLATSQKPQTIEEADDNIVTPQLGLGGFDARYESNADNEISMDFTSNAYSAVSPSIAVAMDTGTDSQKVQLMKLSFFVDDEYDGKSVISEQLDGRDSPDQIVPYNKPYLRHRLQPSSTSSKGVPSITGSSKLGTHTESLSPINHELKIPHTTPAEILKPVGPKSMPLIIKPKVAMVKIPWTVIPFQHSILAQMSGHIAADLAFMKGRSFRIGWGAQNTLFTLNTFENCENLHQKEHNIDNVAKLFSGRNDNDYTRAVLLNFKIASVKPINSFTESIENHLQTQLKYSCIESVSVGDCPHIKTIGGPTILFEHHEVAKANAKLSNSQSYSVTVWSLCNALWGEQEELEGLDEHSHLTVVRRRELLSEWLESVVTDKQSIRDAQTKSSYLSHLLELLSCHKVPDACELAFNNDDMKMSFLLAQLSGGPAVRQLSQHQLSMWQDVEADKFISVDRLKAYMLVAGIPLVSSSHGAINIYRGLNWLKAFALNVWYLCSATSSITDALLAYENSFQSDEFHAVEPTPPYAGNFHVHRNTPVEDLRYHLLKLYSKRSHPLESLLNPATHSADPMDFRLSWLLLQVLETIGYHHSSALCRAQLHTSFASQLENYDLWHWAIFVLLHIDNRVQRELSVQNVLYKFIQLSGDEAEDEEYNDKELFVINDLGVPQRWIFWAKAVRAGAMCKHHAQAEFLLRAEQWAMAHDVIMTHIAPDAVINDNIQYVKNLLIRLDERRDIPNWSNQGLILLDYIDISEKFDQLKTIDERHMETSWEQLKPQLSELCSRINLFPCPTAKHRLCQSEIAQRLANLVSGVRVMCPELNACVLMKVILEKLPLPQEYAKQKFRALIEDSRLVEEMLQSSTLN